MGEHSVAHWSCTQQAVSLSSCENEVNALNKGGTEGLGIKNMIEQCGQTISLHFRTDAIAAPGVVERVGAGKVKHLSIQQFWAQDKVAKGEMIITKVPREENCSDLLTHHWCVAEGEKFLKGMGVVRLASRDGQQGEGVC